MSTSLRRALFLDRDAVINVDLGYVHRPDQTQWVPGIFDLCRVATDLGYVLVVITNQAGIARGYYGETEFATYTRWVREQFRARGLDILATYHCPHHPTEGIGDLRQDCDCRKPKPGMILRAQRELGIDLAASALLGDQDSDVEAGRSAGVGHCLKLGATRPADGATVTMADAIDWLQSISATGRAPRRDGASCG